MTHWHYEIGGTQQGPVSEDEILELLRRGAISLDTKVWCDELGEKWKPLRQTRLRPVGTPPPLDSSDSKEPAVAEGAESRADPRFAYLIALSPISFGVGCLLMGIRAGTSIWPVVLLIVAVTVVQYMLARADFRLLIQAGMAKPEESIVNTIIISPLFYFLRRLRFVRRPHQFVWLWLALNVAVWVGVFSIDGGDRQAASSQPAARAIGTTAATAPRGQQDAGLSTGATTATLPQPTAEYVSDDTEPYKDPQVLWSDLLQYLGNPLNVAEFEARIRAKGIEKMPSIVLNIEEVNGGWIVQFFGERGRTEAGLFCMVGVADTASVAVLKQLAPLTPWAKFTGTVDSYLVDIDAQQFEIIFDPCEVSPFDGG